MKTLQIKKTGKILLLTVLSIGIFPEVQAQKIGVKTNLLYWLTATPNASLEWCLSPRYSLSFTAGYNAINFPDRTNDEGMAMNPKLHHWVIMPEAKYWFSRVFERGFVGLHALYGKYNAGGVRFPRFLEDGRYKGWGVGAGISYGYQWALGSNWGIEASLGVGYLYLRYDKFDCGSCGSNRGNFKRHYFGPTKAAVSVIYYLR